MRSIGIALLCLLLGTGASRADDLTTLAEAKEMTDKVIAILAEEEFAESYALLKPYWPLPEVEIDSRAQSRSSR